MLSFLPYLRCTLGGWPIEKILLFWLVKIRSLSKSKGMRVGGVHSQKSIWEEIVIEAKLVELLQIHPTEISSRHK